MSYNLATRQKLLIDFDHNFKCTGLRLDKIILLT